MEIEFENGKKVNVEGMDSLIFQMLEKKYDSAIIKIDGVHPAYWSMTEEEIKAERERVANNKKNHPAFWRITKEEENQNNKTNGTTQY